MIINYAKVVHPAKRAASIMHAHVTKPKARCATHLRPGSRSCTCRWRRGTRSSARGRSCRSAAASARRRRRRRSPDSSCPLRTADQLQSNLQGKRRCHIERIGGSEREMERAAETARQRGNSGNWGGERASERASGQTKKDGRATNLS